MPRRTRKDDDSGKGPSGHKPRAGAGKGASRARSVPPRILCIDPSAGTRDALAAVLEPIRAVCDWAGTIAESRLALAQHEYDVIVLDGHQTDGNGLELVRELSGAEGAARCIVASASGEIDAAVEAMRSGAIDFLLKPFQPAETLGRVQAAVDLVRRLRQQQRRVERLQKMCRRLNTAREEVSKQVDVLCNDLVTAYQDLADQMTSVTLASEFSALVRQELDVESLLRTTLEYLLQKTGPTNAAVFLPTGHHDYNLGAYVNYDVPKETADVLLDHLADVIAPRFEHERSVLRFTTDQELAERLGDGAAWLHDSGVVVFACHHEGECLAIVALFRERSAAYTDELLGQLAVMRDVFGEQLARVVRIHHRHLPKHDWGGFDVEDGRGGLAA